MKDSKNYKGYALYILLTCVLYVGCTETETETEQQRTKTTVDVQKYDGCKLLDRSVDFDREAPGGAYLHTFRKNDSVWSESYMYGCFVEYSEGEIIHAVGNVR